MKKIIIIAPIVAVLIALAVALPIILSNQTEFSGNRVANPDLYRLDIERMNGSDSHSMELEAGDCMEVHFKTTGGSLNLKINSPDGSVIYEGNGENATDFEITAQSSGRYVINLSGKNAKGDILVTIKEKK